MVDEADTTRESGAAPPTTIIHEVRSGGGAGWVIAVVLVLALIGGIWLFNQSNTSQANRDSAVAAAARNVGDAAKDVGDAAQEAVKNVRKP